MYVHHSIHSNTRNQKYHWINHTPGNNPSTEITIRCYQRNNQRNNWTKVIKKLQNIVGKSLYDARAIDPTMLMALNSLVVVQTKPKIETVKHITQFLNYSASHPEAVISFLIFIFDRYPCPHSVLIVG